MSLDTTPYKKYFGGVIQRMGLLPIIRESQSTLSLTASIPVGTETARFQITLGLVDDRSCWVIEEFFVITANPFTMLWGKDLLAHYGKRPANREYDLSRPGGDLWEITCAANLQALMVAYDNLAKELGLPLIFGH